MGNSSKRAFSPEREAQLKKNRESFVKGYEVLSDDVVGLNHWLLVKDPDGKRFIGLFLLGTPFAAGMTEHEGPNQINCPVELIDQAGETDSPTAGRWRQRVRDYHAANSLIQEKLQNLEQGDVLMHGGVKYLFTKNPGDGDWILLREADGKIFSMTASQIEDAIKEGRITTHHDRVAQRKAAEAAKREASARAKAVRKGFAVMQRDSKIQEGEISLGLGLGDTALVFEE